MKITQQYNVVICFRYKNDCTDTYDTIHIEKYIFFKHGKRNQRLRSIYDRKKRKNALMRYFCIKIQLFYSPDLFQTLYNM